MTTTAGLSSSAMATSHSSGALQRRAGESHAHSFSAAASTASISTGDSLRGILLPETNQERLHDQAASSKASSMSTSAFMRAVFAEHSPSRSDDQEVTSKAPEPNPRGSPLLTRTSARGASPSDDAHTAAAASASAARGKGDRPYKYEPEERKRRRVESKYRTSLRRVGIPAPYAPGSLPPKDPHSQAGQEPVAAQAGSRTYQPLDNPIPRRRPGPKPGTVVASSAYTEEERKRRAVESQQRYRLRLAGVAVPPADGYKLRTTRTAPEKKVKQQRQKRKEQRQTAAGSSRGQGPALPADVGLPQPLREATSEEKKRRRAEIQRRYRLKAKGIAGALAPGHEPRTA